MFDKETTTQEYTAPWGPSTGPLRQVMRDATDLYESGDLVAAPFPGERVAPLSGQTLGAIDRLGGGTASLPVADQTLVNLMGEDNMYRDFDTIRQTVGDEVASRMGSQFAGGSLNSSLAQDAYTRAMTEALAGVEYDAYNAAQNRRLQAAGLSPSIASGMIAEDKGALIGGGLLDRQAQRLIDAERELYGEQQDEDLNALLQYANIAQGIGGMGGTTVGKTTEPITLSEIGKLLSGGGTFWDAIA